jgi:hypothetical protein
LHSVERRGKLGRSINPYFNSTRQTFVASVLGYVARF